jgi:hypothetical protein
LKNLFIQKKISSLKDLEDLTLITINNGLLTAMTPTNSRENKVSAAPYEVQ